MNFLWAVPWESRQLLLAEEEVGMNIQTLYEDLAQIDAGTTRKLPTVEHLQAALGLIREAYELLTAPDPQVDVRDWTIVARMVLGYTSSDKREIA